MLTKQVKTRIKQNKARRQEKISNRNRFGRLGISQHFLKNTAEFVYSTAVAMHNNYGFPEPLKREELVEGLKQALYDLHRGPPEHGLATIVPITRTTDGVEDADQEDLSGGV